jgi:hypothetical protein
MIAIASRISLAPSAVTDPRSFNPISAMPPQPTFDDKTFNALEVYFKAMMPIE